MRDGSRSVPISGGERACAALRATRLRDPKTLVLAVPVAPTENLAAMREDADDVVCLENHARFRATGFGGAWKLFQWLPFAATAILVSGGAMAGH